MSNKSNTSESPVVSVIMPVYNCELYLEEAIDSILNQTYLNLELIAVDDHSTDKSWDIIQNYAKKDKRVKPFHNKENLKQTRTRNFAIRQASGKFIALMDSDDVRITTSIEKQVDFLLQHPKVVAVGGAAEFADEKMNRLNDRLYPTADADIRKTFFRFSPFCLASLVIRSECLEKPDAYIKAMEPAEDIDLTLRLGLKGQLANLDEVLYRVRTHRRSVSQTQARVMERKTLYLRVKAVFEYGYIMTTQDKLYFLVQLTTMYFMPQRFRFWLFNKLRA